MSIQYENLRFLVRGGTAGNLAIVNEIPLKRELVIETDTGLMKLGDGVTPYNDLEYLSGGTTFQMRVADGFIQTSVDEGVTWENLIALADLTGPKGDKGDQGDKGDTGAPGPSSTTFPTATFDGGLGDIKVGAFCDLPVPFGFEISKYTLVANAAGVLQVDVRVASYATFPPDPADSICGSARPTLVAADKIQDDVLAGWDTVIPSGSVIRFQVTACDGISRATLVLEGART